MAKYIIQILTTIAYKYIIYNYLVDLNNIYWIKHIFDKIFLKKNKWNVIYLNLKIIFNFSFFYNVFFFLIY